MDCFLLKCTKCGIEYLTKYESGEHTCPDCGNVNKILIGDDAVKAMVEQAKKDGEKEKEEKP
jgi:peptide subunit release factor 1 (eRF1)